MDLASKMLVKLVVIGQRSPYNAQFMDFGSDLRSFCELWAPEVNRCSILWTSVFLLIYSLAWYFLFFYYFLLNYTIINNICTFKFIYYLCDIKMILYFIDRVNIFIVFCWFWFVGIFWRILLEDIIGGYYRRTLLERLLF